MWEFRDEIDDLFGAASAVDGHENRRVPNGCENGAEDTGLVLHAAGPTVESDFADECESSEELVQMISVEAGASGRHSWVDTASPDQVAVSSGQDVVGFVERSGHRENESIAESVELAGRYIGCDVSMAIQ